MIVLPLRLSRRSFQCRKILLAIRVSDLRSGRPFGTSLLGRKDAEMGDEKRGSIDANAGRRDRSCVPQSMALCADITLLTV